MTFTIGLKASLHGAAGVVGATQAPTAH